MKNNSDESPVRKESFEEKEPLKKGDKPINLKSKADSKVMTEQLIAPPAYIWDKIESVLDAQQDRREKGTEIISASLHKAKAERKKKLLVAVAGLTVLAGFLMIVF